MERELIVERTRAGLTVARAEGRIGGRRPKFSSEEWAQMRRLIKMEWSESRFQLFTMLEYLHCTKNSLCLYVRSETS